MKGLLSYIKTIWVLSTVISLCSVSTFSQNYVSDTIPWNSIYLKSAKYGTIETRAERNLTVVINEILASNSGGIRDSFGEQDDWFELYNYGDEPVKLNGLYFSDDKDNPYKWEFTSSVETFLAPGNFVHFWADNSPEQGDFHAGFKLSSGGEFIGIFSEEGDLINGFSFSEQTTDISYGRYPDGGSNFHFFETTTPSRPNHSGGVAGILSEPTSNIKGGFFDEPQILKITTPISDAKIRYTIDFSIPSQTSPIFNDSLIISETTIVRAAVFKQGYANSTALTLSFLFDENVYTNPSISLVGDQEHFFGEKGILKLSNQDLEIPANLEFIKNGTTLFSSGSGIHVHSPKSQKQYSLRLYARGVYGNSWFEFPFFDEEGPNKFKRLILRNAGNDNVQGNTSGTHFRDLLVHQLAKKTNVRPMLSESKAVNVFINGEFYGVYNLRERIDEFYIETHTGVTEDYNLLERAFGYSGNRNTISGSFDPFSAQVNYLVTETDKNDSIVIDSIASMFDIENFRDYWITEVFSGNYDWLSNNVKYWCPDGGKWQWIYWDLDHAVGYPYQKYGSPEWNTLKWSLGFADRAWSSGYNNRVIRNLLENDAFKTNFIQRFTYYLNTHFSYSNTTNLVDSLASNYRSDMPTHFARWPASNMDNWENAIKTLDNYMLERPDIVMQHLKLQFNLQDPVKVKIKVSPAYFGEVEFSTGVVTNSSFEGDFFPNMNYNLIAKAKDGFRFAGWEGINDSLPETVISLTDSIHITALFVEENPLEPLVINEIYNNNNLMFDAGDWVELLNTSPESIDLSSYQLHINSHSVTLPEGTIIQANSMMVLVSNKTHFKHIYKNELALVEISELEIPEDFTLKLWSNSNELIDVVTLISNTKISTQNKNKGFSMELNSWYLDNNTASNWTTSTNRFGSPGLENDQKYYFSDPTSQDVEIIVYDTNPVEILASNFIINDDDKHGLAGIQFSSMSNLNALSINNERLNVNQIYPLNKLMLSLNENIPEAQFTFALIDSSFAYTAEHSLSTTYVVSTTNLNNETLRVYPIPCNDFCFIEGIATDASMSSISLWNLSGKQIKVFNNVVANTKLKLDVSDIPNGIYLLKLGGFEKSNTLKLLISR